MPPESPAKQLAAFMRPYSPEVEKTARAALTKIRAQIPGAMEMVYNTYNALVIGFGPNDRASEAIVSIALYPKWVNLYFLEGALLPDPEKLLKGSGKHVRTLRLDDAAVLDRRRSGRSWPPPSRTPTHRSIGGVRDVCSSRGSPPASARVDPGRLCAAARQCDDGLASASTG